MKRRIARLAQTALPTRSVAGMPVRCLRQNQLAIVRRLAIFTFALQCFDSLRGPNMRNKKEIP
jgi:hypothetical protein